MILDYNQVPNLFNSKKKKKKKNKRKEKNDCKIMWTFKIDVI